MRRADEELERGGIMREEDEDEGARMRENEE